ncbi:cytosolic iron-sulfur assembly component 2b [Anaeramoeba flamelloides]|uniref:Cytosolic iron-sulfur assembly component 2b n=1 Tax=Anaeramoeba flamelloides TaxID=1746091 RepID=A0AAV7Z3N2_9EUKA|nr:cytosolic iron-sulfur assembly component 2b [Anaeramoeba flamelloides]
MSSTTEEVDSPNPNPLLKKKIVIVRENQFLEEDETVEDPIDSLEIYETIKGINDPEYPFSLEELGIISPEQIQVDSKRRWIKVEYTPTVPNCKLSTLIGLSVRTKLLRSFPSYKYDVVIEKGKHDTEEEINKQVNDKERCFAALEQRGLKRAIDKCLATSLSLTKKEIKKLTKY